MTGQEIKVSITEKALEYGVPSPYAKLFDDLLPDFKAEFRKCVLNRDFGLPIVRYGHPNGHWVLIGTKEIAWQNEQLHFLPIDQLTIFTVPQKEIDRSKEIQPDRMMRKFEYEILTINTLDKNSYDIWLHKGKEYYGFWHMMIRFFDWRNNDRREII